MRVTPFLKRLLALEPEQRENPPHPLRRADDPRPPPGTRRTWVAFCAAVALMWGFTQELTVTQRQVVNALIDLMQGQPERCYSKSGGPTPAGSDEVGPGAP